MNYSIWDCPCTCDGHTSSVTSPNSFGRAPNWEIQGTRVSIPILSVIIASILFYMKYTWYTGMRILNQQYGYTWYLAQMLVQVLKNDTYATKSQ